MDKITARQMIRKKKRQMSLEEIEEKSKRIIERLIASEVYQKATTLYCYVSYNQEVMTKPLIRHALEAGKNVAVPKVNGKDMEFIYLQSLEELRSGYQGIEEPTGFKIACANSVLMLMPGLAFDRKGNRVGYGGGFYDRYLEQYREFNFTKLALAFDFQIMDSLEIEECDKQVDMIITEERKFCFYEERMNKTNSVQL